MQDDRPLPEIVGFGPFRASLRTGEVRLNGHRLKLPEQSFQILAALLSRPGELVTREELRRRLWPEDTFVDYEHGLNVAVQRLREALGDSASEAQYIETLPRRGYRFIAPVEAIEPAPEAPVDRWGTSVRTKWALASASTVALLAVLGIVLALNPGGLRDRLLGHPAPGEITSIAVLPLENLSGDPDQEYFADGMHDALITELGKISSLRVISRQSVMQFKGSHKPLKAIAGALGVDAVVEGTVARDRQRVRVTAQLIEVNPERHLWAQEYERDLGGVLALQGDVARAIAREVRAVVTPEEQTRLAARPVNPEAHQAYLRGRYFWSKRSPEGMKKAVEYFQQAIDADPTFAPAYAGLADTYGVHAGVYLGLTREERHDRQEAAIQKALELDDSLAEAHASLGKLKERQWNWAGAEKEYRRAIDLNPSYATARQWFSNFLFNLGRYPDEALRHAKLAVQLDPLSPIINSNLCGAYYTLGKYELAIEQCQKTLTLDDKHIPAYILQAFAYYEMGQGDKAAEEEERALVLEEGPEVARQYRKRYEAEGWPGLFHWWIDRLEAQRARGEDVRMINIAACYVALGEGEKALRALEEGYQRRDPDFEAIAVMREFQPLHPDPHFQDLVRRLHLPE